MNKRPINKMLDILVERKPTITETFTYQEIMNVLSKSNENITYAEKMMVKEGLRTLCIICGLSYERLVMKVCRN